MSKLQIADVAWMPVTCDGDDVVDGGAHGMRVLERLVNGLPAYGADVLCGKDYLSVCLKLCAMRAVTIRPSAHTAFPSPLSVQTSSPGARTCRMAPYISLERAAACSLPPDNPPGSEGRASEDLSSQNKGPAPMIAHRSRTAANICGGYLTAFFHGSIVPRKHGFVLSENYTTD